MKELRQFSSPLDLKRVESEEDCGILEGYFITFNAPAPCGNYDFYEMVDPSALANTLAAERDIRCFYNHNYDVVLGRESNNTLTLRVDNVGLWGRCVLNLNDSQARDIFERVKRRDITGCSFGAYINNEELIERDGQQTFVIKDIDLVEISVCPMPFYDSTTMEARSGLISRKQEVNRKRKLLEEKYSARSIKSEE